MTISKLACKTIPTSHHYGRRTAKVCKITPHHMAGNLTIEGCGAVFQNREASSNYGIGTDGRIACYVDEDYGAWTSSSYWNDNQAITIEVANSQAGGDWPVSDAAWKSLVNLCADICKRYGFRLSYTGDRGGSLTEHRMFDATACPGPYLHARMAQLAKEVNAVLDGGSTGGLDINGKWDATTKKAIQGDLAAQGYYGGGIDGDFGYWSWKAVQEKLADEGQYSGFNIDGDGGYYTICAWQLNTACTGVFTSKITGAMDETFVKALQRLHNEGRL